MFGAGAAAGGRLGGRLGGGECGKGRRMLAEVPGRARILVLWGAKKVAAAGELTQREQEEDVK